MLLIPLLVIITTIVTPTTVAYSLIYIYTYTVGSVYRSPDLGLTWYLAPVSIPLPIQDFTVINVDGTILVIAGIAVKPSRGTRYMSCT